MADLERPARDFPDRGEPRTLIPGREGRDLIEDVISAPRDAAERTIAEGKATLTWLLPLSALVIGVGIYYGSKR